MAKQLCAAIDGVGASGHLLVFHVDHVVIGDPVDEFVVGVDPGAGGRLIDHDGEGLPLAGTPTD